MEKVELRTADIAAENAAKLAELFPDIVTEVLDEDGNVRHSIDVEALKAHVGDIAEDKRERYQFTWPGKQKARAEAIRAIDKTMRPCPEESVNWDNTENLLHRGRQPRCPEDPAQDLRWQDQDDLHRPAL